jgi:hypothetical protein
VPGLRAMPSSNQLRSQSPARFAVAVRLSLLALLPVAAGAKDYDAPNFDQALVDADALSLGSREMGEIVTALTALVSNFPDEAVVDADVKEKALAVALALRPLDGGARSAHRALLSGSLPIPVELFQSLPAVSSALWRHGERLAKPGAEPEDRRLAPLLMELSLLTQAGRPLPERLRAFQEAAEAVPLNWNRTVTLQRDLNASNQRATALFRPVREPEPDIPAPIVAATTPPAAAGPTPTDANPPMAAAASTDDRPISEVKRRDGAITFIGRDENSGLAVAGVASLSVREPTPDEASLFGLFTDQETSRTFEMRLTYDREGATVTGIDVAGALVRQKYVRWPLQLLAEFGFSPARTEGASPRVNVSLPSLILLASAFSGEVIGEAFLPTGEYALAGDVTEAGGAKLSAKPAAVDYARAAGTMATAPKVLFLPVAAGDTGVVSSLVETAIDGDPAALFRPQLIGFATLEDLRPILLGQTPEALQTAITEFAAIQALTDKMEMGAIARNEVVRERLTKVVQAWPGHASAQALLDFGARPEDAGMSLTSSVKAIEAAMDPAIERYEARENGQGFVTSTTTDLLDAARIALMDLRPKIDSQAKTYQKAAEDALEACKVYLSLTNTGTSLAQQRHRELEERLTFWRAERAKLGVGESER